MMAFCRPFPLLRTVNPGVELCGGRDEWPLNKELFDLGLLTILPGMNPLGTYPLATVCFWLRHFSLGVSPGFVSWVFPALGGPDIHILRAFCNVPIYIPVFPVFWLTGCVNIYKNLSFIFSCSRGKPQGKSQDNWILDVVTWQLIFSVP